MTAPVHATAAATRAPIVGISVGPMRAAAVPFLLVVFFSVGIGAATADITIGAKAAVGLFHVVFVVLALFRRRSALAFLMMCMPLNPLMFAYGGMRTLTFAYWATLLMLLDLRAVLRRIFPLARELMVFLVVIAFGLVSLTWTLDVSEGFGTVRGYTGIVVASLIPVALFREHADLERTCHALVLGGLVLFVVVLGLTPGTGERLGSIPGVSLMDVGMRLGVSAASALYLAGLARGRTRIFRWVAFGVFSTGVLLTLSRGPTVALILGCGAMILMSRQYGRALGRVALLLGTFLFVGSAVREVANPAVLEERLEGTFSGTSVDSISTGRLSIWSVGLEMMRAAPFTGVGAGSFVVEYDRYYRVSSATHGYGRHPGSHSVPVMIAAEQGLPACALYLAFIGLGLRRAWRVRHTSGVGPLAVCMTLMAMVLSTLNHTYEAVLWWGFGLALWIERFPRVQPVTPQRP